MSAQRDEAPFATEDAILVQAKTIAVIGLSSNPARDSHRVSLYMQQRGYRIIPVNPQESGTILDEPVYPSLAEVPESIEVDLVNVFRRSSQTDPAIDAAIERDAPAIWLQLDIVNDEGMRRAEAAGLQAVQDRCLMVEHRRWLRDGGTR